MLATSEWQRVKTSGWRTGLANLLRRESMTWWASRRWLTQALTWAVIVNGTVVLMMFVLPALVNAMGQPGAPPMDALALGVQTLFDMGCGALAMGTIVLVQSAIIGERQLGVTEWLLSKPASRAAYVLSKLLAHGLGVLVILVGLQSAIAYGLLTLKLGAPYPLLPYLVGVAGMAVHTLFYLALTVMMGVLTTNRNQLMGAALGMLMGGQLAINFLGKYAMWTPWFLGKALGANALGVALPASIWQPIGVTAALAALCVAVALIKFERLEF